MLNLDRTRPSIAKIKQQKAVMTPTCQYSEGRQRLILINDLFCWLWPSAKTEPFSANS
jgi:hypothetical protein